VVLFSGKSRLGLILYFLSINYFFMSLNLSHQKGYIAIDGDQVYYEVQGQGQPLLLIPGGTGDSWWLHKIASALSKDFKVITYDLRGTARSIASKPLNIEIGRLSADAVAVLERLGEHSAFIVGVSSGAVIGLDLASRYPDYVKALVAFEPPLIRIHPRKQQLQKLIAKANYIALRWGADWAGLRFAIGVGLPIKPVLKGAAEYKEYIALTKEPQVSPSVADEYLQLVMLTNYLPQIGRLKDNKILVFTGAAENSLEGKRFYAETAKILAEQLACKMIVFPGHHFSFFHFPGDCAKVIKETLLNV